MENAALGIIEMLDLNYEALGHICPALA